MRTNVLPTPPKTHEGAAAMRIGQEKELRRTVMACMLWESTFYESGQSVADRIADLVGKVSPEKVAAIAVEARGPMNLRHVPLKLCVELSKRGQLKAETLAAVIHRADELSEYCSLLMEACPGKTLGKILGNQSRKGLAMAFTKFNEYALAKYDRAGKVRLRDVLFLCHAKPKDAEQTELWKRLVDNKMATPDTWEVELSASKDKTASWNRLLSEKKLGALALLRNLRNMTEAKIPRTDVASALMATKMDRVLPFRFIAAARAVPGWEDIIEPAMLKSMEGAEKLAGKTCLVVDNSGSMYGAKVSVKSDMDRSDAACALAIMCREICEEVSVVSFSARPAHVPSRRGFGLADAIKGATEHGGTNTMDALAFASAQGYDRIVVITDEQSHQKIGPPLAGSTGYVINVSIHQNGIGYGAWTHIDGFSESVIDFVRQSEKSE